MNGPAREEAPAKLNLALHVRGRRADGYHDLETLFAFTRFGDRVEAEPAAEDGLSIAGPEGKALADAGGQGGADNLVLRAARLFAEQSGVRQRHHFRLWKEIPVAAGLGGGSADAAATLRLLNRLAGYPLPPAALHAVAAGLGADVPACLASGTALGTGRGDVLRPAPALAGMGVLLANPRVAVATGLVFRSWGALGGGDGGPLAEDWRRERNDLERAAIHLHPEIADVLAWLGTLPGAIVARMAGSGATCFALFAGEAPDVAPPGHWWSRRTSLRRAAFSLSPPTKQRAATDR